MNLGQILPSLAGLGVLLGFSAFFSGSETALCALTRSQVERLRADSARSSRLVVRFVDDPRRLFITILLGNTFVNIAFATLTASLIYGLFGEGRSGAAIAIATVVITLALLVFGEITPKTFAIRHATSFAAVTAPILWGFSILIRPLRTVLRAVTDLLLPLFGGSHQIALERITPDDLKALVEGQDLGALGADEREILGRILDLRQIAAWEIMVPRTEIVAMRSSSTVGEVLERAKSVGFSRIPIYRDGIDDIVGVFRVKDWLAWRDQDLDELSVDDFLGRRDEHPTSGRALLVHPPFFTPEMRPMSDLLSELRRNGSEVAFLVDEFGGVSGSLTTEDIVEEVVGEIVDEHDSPVLMDDFMQRLDEPNAYEVAGRVSVPQVNRRLDLDLDEGRADTLGGYVFALLGHLPTVGESVVDGTGVRFTVAGLVGRAVGSVVITVPGTQT